MKSNRILINVRMNKSGVELLDHVAGEHDVTRSDVMRASMALALNHQEELTKMLNATKEQL